MQWLFPLEILVKQLAWPGGVLTHSGRLSLERSTVCADVCWQCSSWSLCFFEASQISLSSYRYLGVSGVSVAPLLLLLWWQSLEIRRPSDSLHPMIHAAQILELRDIHSYFYDRFVFEASNLSQFLEMNLANFPAGSALLIGSEPTGLCWVSLEYAFQTPDDEQGKL